MEIETRVHKVTSNRSQVENTTKERWVSGDKDFSPENFKEQGYYIPNLCEVWEKSPKGMLTRDYRILPVR